MTPTLMRLPRPTEFDDQYFTPSDDVLKSIGYVVIAAAGPEDLLHHLYWDISMLNKKCGPIVTKDMRPNRMAEDLAKMAETSGYTEDKVSALKNVLSDLKRAIEDRNRCIHWIWDKNKKGEHRISAPQYKGEKGGELPITPEYLRSLALDFAWIETRLNSFLLTEKELTKKRDKQGALKDVYVPAPWLNDSQSPPE